MTWKLSQMFESRQVESPIVQSDSLASSTDSTSSTTTVKDTSVKQSMTRVSFRGDVDIIVVEAAASSVPADELWWKNEELQVSKKECVVQLQEIFRTNPAIRNGKQALQEFMLTI